MKTATKLCVNVSGLNNQEIPFDSTARIRSLTQHYSSTQLQGRAYLCQCWLLQTREEPSKKLPVPLARIQPAGVKV